MSGDNNLKTLLAILMALLIIDCYGIVEFSMQWIGSWIIYNIVLAVMITFLLIVAVTAHVVVGLIWEVD